jgi:hypothetical protein
MLFASMISILSAARALPATIVFLQCSLYMNHGPNAVAFLPTSATPCFFNGGYLG